MKEIVITPTTRLEGHGKIVVCLDDQGTCTKAYLQIPEIRGFEKFAEGRHAEDMPQITQRICGVCPEAHHMASAKAADAGTAATSYRVKSGDTLYRIALRPGVTVAAIPGVVADAAKASSMKAAAYARSPRALSTITMRNGAHGVIPSRTIPMA